MKQFSIEYMGQEYNVWLDEQGEITDVEGTHGLVDPDTVGELVEVVTDDVFHAYSNPQVINVAGKPHIFKSLADYIYEMKG